VEFAFFLLGVSIFSLLLFPSGISLPSTLLSCRDKPALPFAAHPPIIPNTENTVERYYYYRLFGIVAFLLGLLRRDTW